MTQLALVLLLSFLLGMALNRGSTCAVLATEELLLKRRPARFLSFFEAALWGVLCLAVMGVETVLRPDWMGWGLVIGGSALFGLGAALNGACAFGVVGRIGSGQVEYLLTGAGLFAASYCLQLVFGDQAMTQSGRAPALPWAAAIVLLAALAALRHALGRQRPRAFLRLTLAMAVVGVTFVALGQVHQPFPWVSALVRLPAVDLLPVLAVLALLAGSAANAAVTGRGIRLRAPTLAGSLRRFAGGALMGAGALLVPGGNDSVLLYGMPAGEPQAFAAYAAMIGAIAAAILLGGRVTEAWKTRG
jgi:uncharacterized membrane protein YedE/YeeE